VAVPLLSVPQSVLPQGETPGQVIGELLGAPRKNVGVVVRLKNSTAG